MMADFDQHMYFPALMSKVAEIQGLRELSAQDKDRIIPLFILGKWHSVAEVDRAIENCSAGIGGHRHFFADLTREVRHSPDSVRRLLVADDDFAAWREYVSRYENAVPVVQLVPGATRRQVTRQAQLLERSKGQLAFRIRNPTSDVPLVINALSALDDVRNSITFIDVGYIRDDERVAEAVVADTIDRIRNEVSDARMVVLSSSFPSYLADYADDDEQTRGSLEILERRLHEAIVANGRECLYGDYASIHPIVRSTGGGGAPIPRIDIGTPLRWHFARRPTMRETRNNAYVDIATELVERYPEIAALDCWGARMVRQAANGDPHGVAASSWISVRVNIHLSQQIRHLDQLEAAEDLDDEL